MYVNELSHALQRTPLCRRARSDRRVAWVRPRGERKERPTILEAGLWLARSARGRGVGTAVLQALLEEAGETGATAVVAETSTTNAAALGVLSGSGGTLRVDEASGRVHAELPVSRRPPTCASSLN